MEVEGDGGGQTVFQTDRQTDRRIQIWMEYKAPDISPGALSDVKDVVKSVATALSCRFKTCMQHPSFLFTYCVSQRSPAPLLVPVLGPKNGGTNGIERLSRCVLS